MTTPQTPATPDLQAQAVARVREEFEIVARLGSKADIDSAMLNVMGLLATRPAEPAPVVGAAGDWQAVLELAKDYARLIRDEAWGSSGIAFDKLRVAVRALAAQPFPAAAPVAGEAESYPDSALGFILEALEANHLWHQDYDDHGGYPDSELEARNVQAIATVRAAVKTASERAQVTQAPSVEPQQGAEAVAWQWRKRHTWFTGKPEETSFWSEWEVLQPPYMDAHELAKSDPTNYEIRPLYAAPQAARLPLTEWVSVEDRLPEEHERVLMYRPNFGYNPTEFAEGYWYLHSGGERGWCFAGASGIPAGSGFRPPTHWMPLPTPPGIGPATQEVKS